MNARTLATDPRARIWVDLDDIGRERRSHDQIAMRPPAIGFGDTLATVPDPSSSYWEDGDVHAWAIVPLDDDAIPSDRCRPVLARPLSIRSGQSGRSSRVVRCSCGVEISPAHDRAGSIAAYAAHVSGGDAIAIEPATSRALEIAIDALDLAVDRARVCGPSAASLAREIRDLISFPRAGAEL